MDENFWFYIYDPAWVMAPSYGQDDSRSPLTIHWLLSEFIQWKNDKQLGLERALAEMSSGMIKDYEEFASNRVWPTTPRRFYDILTQFKPSADPVTLWIDGIEKLHVLCQEGDWCSKCRLGRSGEHSFPCPQDDVEMNQRLKTLAHLALWRTRFLGGREELDEPKRGDLLKQAVHGLEQAARDLRGDPNNPLPDFNIGAERLAGERALLRHFCATALVEAVTEFGEEWRNPKAQPTQLEFAARLASLAATLLGEGHWKSEAIENLQEVVALYRHRILGIPERVDLVRHLRQTLRGEPALHTLKTRYRDHFFHTLEVCFLGSALLRSRPDPAKEETFATVIRRGSEGRRKWEDDKNRAEGKSPEKQSPLPASDRELLAQWWVASLVHDTAYGVDIHGATLKLLNFFSNRPEVKGFTEEAQKAVGGMAEKLAKLAPELEGDHSLKKGDHGVIAAASLHEILKTIGPETEARYRGAVRAVAFHNTRHPRVNAAADPIAALLILCDTVQEWGRSAIGFAHSPAVVLSRLVESAQTPDGEQFGPVKRYGLSLVPSDARGVYHWKVKNQLTIALDYGEQVLKGCAAKYVWADMTYNLQRVDFRPWGLDLRVEVTIPRPGLAPEKPSEKDKNKSQFEYFGDFVAEQEVRFVEKWYATALKGDPSLAVSYDEGRRNRQTRDWEELLDGAARNGTERERICFNLPALSEAFVSEKAMMGGTGGKFGEAIEKWSVYAKEKAEEPPTQRPPV